MRIASFADAHLGYESNKSLKNSKGQNLRKTDGIKAFSLMVNDIIRNKVDAVIVGGDTFHTPYPDVATIIAAQRLFKKFAKAGIPVYALAGNHDVSDVEADVAASLLLHDPDRKIYSHVEPYVKYEIGDGVMLHMISHHMYSEQENTMSKVKPEDGKINILSTHGSLIDPITQMKLHTNQSPREVIIPDHLMKDNQWDYTILGHIHTRGWVGSNDNKTDTTGSKIFYNGSLLRRGFADDYCEIGRGWTLWEIKPDGTFTYELKTIAERPQYDFEIINASNLSSKELTETIVGRLKETQYNGTEFDEAQAPLLRQRVINLDASKYSGLDRRLIQQNTAHAFSFELKQLTKSEQIQEATKNVTEEIDYKGNDIMEIYDDWIQKSKSFNNTDDKIKETIKKQTRDFLEIGQEVVLND